MEVFVHTRKTGNLKGEKWRIYVDLKTSKTYKSLRSAIEKRFPGKCRDEEKLAVNFNCSMWSEFFLYPKSWSTADPAWDSVFVISMASHKEICR